VESQGFFVFTENVVPRVFNDFANKVGIVVDPEEAILHLSCLGEDLTTGFYLKEKPESLDWRHVCFFWRRRSPKFEV